MVWMDGTNIVVCPCVLLAWYVIGRLFIVYGLVNYYITTNPPSYNIVRCGFCLTMLYLSDDPVSLHGYTCVMEWISLLTTLINILIPIVLFSLVYIITSHGN